MGFVSNIASSCFALLSLRSLEFSGPGSSQRPASAPEDANAGLARVWGQDADAIHPIYALGLTRPLACGAPPPLAHCHSLPHGTLGWLAASGDAVADQSDGGGWIMDAHCGRSHTTAPRPGDPHASLTEKKTSTLAPARRALWPLRFVWVLFSWFRVESPKETTDIPRLPLLLTRARPPLPPRRSSPSCSSSLTTRRVRCSPLTASARGV